MRLITPQLAPRRGFSLIELMVVLVLIGILTAVMIPEMRGTFEDALLRSTGRKLVDVFTLANSRAITVNQLHRVRIDRKHGRYFVERSVRDGEGGSGLIPMRDVPGGEGEIDSRITVEIRTPDEEPSTGPEREPTFASGDDLGKRNRDKTIAFYADGTADASEVLLRDREGFRLVLRINPVTARIHIIELQRD